MTRYPRKWRLAALGAAVATALALPVSAQAAEPADVQDVLKAYQAEVGPGAAVYADSGAGPWELSAGTAKYGTVRSITSADHYRIGSQTKTFTAVVTMQLVDEGEVVLDEPIERYLPGLVAGNGHDGNAITVRQLLQHTSGIPTNNNPTPKANPDGTYELIELVRDGLSHPSVSEPGAEFHYSNTNYEILGMLIEEVTGAPVGQEITNRIIQPLGLTDTSYPAAGDRSIPAPLINGYIGGRIPPFFLWIDATAFEPSFFGPAGGMISTQQDITRFYQAVVAGELTSPESLAEMRRTVPAHGAEVGLGLISYTLSCGAVTWGHNGMVPGFMSNTEVTADGRNAATVTNANVMSPKYRELVDAAICG
ncbi:D-alanyl-D-alanine carboxypeptidase [Saccharopolyspora kobensis]|uniref:D-alanyl-D-alanine carboxypeptidase n=1 Tax=Saccharopolyspora kobensis TaxID=146035 RepID=A0A1H6D6Q9_9PSEU|nr:serine hydrolase domain-containing protein [Saccharopolyspora kobensis]SEG80266.1 D-alanyl-D-alanine carboxypeptidase [Saccharopolyspora kobensis]SFD11339.1 D-alanyl-D-alanine carboxypeptidase [Saccharopolyspora kobensis]